MWRAEQSRVNFKEGNKKDKRYERIIKIRNRHEEKRKR